MSDTTSAPEAGAALANDMDFYIPTRRAFEEGNYEPTACPLEPGCGELLVEAAVRLLNELEPPTDREDANITVD